MVKAEKSPRIPSKRQPRASEPLELRLTVRLKFGDSAADSVTMMDDRRIPMVDSVFKSRQRILRAFALLLVKAAAAQPKIAREILPWLRLVKRGGRRLAR